MNEIITFFQQAGMGEFLCGIIVIAFVLRAVWEILTGKD